MLPRRVPVLRVLAALGVGAATLCAQNAVLDEGRRFTARLQLNQSADEQLFASVGPERAAALLQAVLDRGQEPSATPDDWKNLHRATQGLIELRISRKEIYEASIYASLQNNFYANNERDYGNALAAARQSLARQEQSGVSSTLYLAHSAIGRDLAQLGQMEDALAEFRTALQLDTDPKSPAGAQRRRDAIQTEIALKDIAGAQRDAAALETAAQPIGGLYRAYALLARADLEIAAASFQQAIDTIADAEHLAAGDKVFPYAALTEVLACVLGNLDSGTYAEAQSLAQHIRTSISDLPVDINGFVRQAILARRRIMGDLDGVLRDDSLRLAAARESKNIPAQVEELESIAVTYQALHARAQRAAVLEEAITLLSAPAVSKVSIQLFNNLGAAYNDLGDPRAAQKFRQSLAAIASLPAADRPLLEGLASEARLGLARAAEIDDDPDTARDQLEAENKLHPDSPYCLLAWARLEKNMREQPRKAGDLYAKAAGLFHEGKLRQAEIAVRLEYARFLIATGAARIPDALTLAATQLSVIEVLNANSEDAEASWQLPYSQGILAEAQGQPDAAIVHYRDAVAKLEALRSGIADATQRQAFADSALIQDLYSRLVALYAGRNAASTAWDYLEREKARAFDEMLTGHHTPASSSEGPEWNDVHRIEQQVASLRADLTGPSEGILRDSGRSPAVMRAQLKSLESAYSVARERVLVSGSRSAFDPAARSIDPDHVRQLIPRGTALIEFAILPGRLASFVIARDSVKLQTWPCDSAELNRKILRLRRALESPDSGREFDDASADLSANVFTPIASEISASVTRLIVVPAGQLFEVPFQILRLPSGGLLLDRFTISYLPSATALTALQSPPKFTDKLWLGAIGNTSVDGMPPLPGTLRETSAIAALDPHAEVLTASAFTHDAALSALRKDDEVHFATHGILDDDAPLFSALLTNPAAGEPSRLSLFELLDSPVHAWLVVLSACETGLGRLSGGDEMVGLTRSFLAAGARDVVSSLWKVSDDSTAALMRGFYRAMKSGQRPAEALRTAEIEVRAQYPQPFYWAPFVVTGAM